HAVLEYRNTLRRAEQRRGGETAKVERLLKRVALPRGGVHAVRVLIEELRQRRRALVGEGAIPEELNVRGHVAQRPAEPRERRRPDDLDRRQFQRLGTILRGGGIGAQGKRHAREHAPAGER